MDDDIVMGKAMGLKTVQVLTGKSMFRLESCADYVIQNINNVREVI
jgi:phosphoglycolate phosphatase-like HAD superfamily hydrolase